MRLTALALVASAAFAAGTAHAKILAATSYVGDYVEPGTLAVQVPLNNAGATTLLFKTTTANELVRVTYNAKCGVVNTGFLSVTVAIDGAAASPA